MTLSRLRAGLSATAFAAAVAAGPAAAQMAAAAASYHGAPDRVIDFKVDWGPVSLAEVQFRISDAGEDLRLELEGRSVGMARLVADFRSEQTITYAADGRRRYHVVSDFGDDGSLRSVEWNDPAAPPVVEVSASTQDGDVTPIPAAELLNTVDPAYPVLAALAQIEAGGACEGAWRTFDGERRLNVMLEDLGDDVLEADRDWTYGGPARKCRLRFQRVGGFELVSDAPVQAEEDEYERLLWIAQLPDGAAPVKMRVSWPLGYATGRIDLR